MKVSGGGFEQCYNAQAAVDAPTMLVVATGLTQAPNDKQQVTPMIKTLQDQQARLGSVTTLIADTGFCSESNVNACDKAKMEPLIAQARQDHHPHWSERFTEPSALQADATPMQAMAHRLKTQADRAAYALRKQTVEPVFGIIKSVMGFRQFSLRGLRKVTGEWNLVCLAWNVKRLAVLHQKVGWRGKIP
jgi:IS5 family transposase